MSALYVTKNNHLLLFGGEKWGVMTNYLWPYHVRIDLM